MNSQNKGRNPSGPTRSFSKQTLKKNLGISKDHFSLKPLKNRVCFKAQKGMSWNSYCGKESLVGGSLSRWHCRQQSWRFWDPWRLPEGRGRPVQPGPVQPTLKVLHCMNNLPCCASPACCLQSRNCPTVSRRDAGSSLELWRGKKENKNPIKLRVMLHAGLKHCSVSPKQLQNQVKNQNPNGNCPNRSLLEFFEQFKHNRGIFMLEKPSKALKSNLNSLNPCATSTLSLNTFRDEECS